MIPIFEYNDIFDGNDFKASDNPLINEFQEKIKNGFVNAEITGIFFDEYSCEWPYTIIGINEYNKFYIFDFLNKKYPEYGFLDSENNLWLFEDFLSIYKKQQFIDVKYKLE